MTDQTNNRLMHRSLSGRSLPPFVVVEGTGEQVPTDLDAYCDWLNSKRCGWRWGVKMAEHGRVVERLA